MTRLSTTTFAALIVLSALPGAANGQTPSTSKTTATITVEIDPWLDAWKKEQSRPTPSRVARSNLRQLDEALEPYRMTYSDLSEGERIEIRRAFADVIPNQRFTTYRINAPQARAIAYLALGAARRGGRDDRRCEYARRPEPEVMQTGAPARPSWCEASLDTMSRDAAWIHTTILALSRSNGARRAKAEELDDLKSMAERARGIVISTSRCGCAVGDDADALLTSTREAVDAYAASSMPAWMTLRSEQVQRISKLSDSVERMLLRCLSSR